MDNGILGLFLYDQDTKLLENQVYIELRRRGYQPYFLKRNTEVDFYVPDEQLLIQVSYNLQNSETYQREMKALKQAMKDLKIDKSYIITYGEEKTVQVEEGTICIITAWHWLLTKSLP